MMKLRDFPKFLRVKDVDYDVRFARTIPEETKQTVGLCDDSEKVIWLRLKQDRRERYKTLIHEVAHAIECEWGIRIPHRLIYALEEPILRLLEDNL